MLFLLERESKDPISEDDEFYEMEIPAKYEVCSTCDGKGKHVNPSIDSHGLSREDFDDDPDFAEDYFAGRYDVPCNECDGNRVSPEVDWNRMTPEDKKYVEDWIEDHYSYQRECDMERRMGC
jgi:hypothetical protein